MYVKVMAAVIACILLSGEAYSALATTPATENLSWFKKKKKKNSEEERVKSDYTLRCTAVNSTRFGWQISQVTQI